MGGRVIFTLSPIDILAEVMTAFADNRSQGGPCIFASAAAKRVVFIGEPKNLQSHFSRTNELTSKMSVVRTVRTRREIKAAVAFNFWPDVRLVGHGQYRIQSKIRVDQDPHTGDIDFAGDYRHEPLKVENSPHGAYEYVESIPFTEYYPHHQSSPIAAYLIPKNMVNGTEVIVADPIEDHVGERWSQGQTYKATFVPGVIEDRRVILKPQAIEACMIIG